MENPTRRGTGFEIVPWAAPTPQGEFGLGDGVGQWSVDTLGLKDGGPGFKVGDGKPIPDLWRASGRAKPADPAREAELGEAEQEVVFGPLTATLKWLSRPYTYAEVVAKGGNVGGVYIAFRAPAPGKISILKVGMASTFARRMGDRQYVAWSRQFPDLRFFLAEVRGNRGNRGIGGVVQMVEFALARLLRRAGQLKGPQLPFSHATTRGAVKVVNVLPKALEAQLQPALFNPDPTEGGQALPPGTQVTAGQLALPAGFRWEAEQSFQS